MKVAVLGFLVLALSNLAQADDVEIGSKLGVSKDFGWGNDGNNNNQGWGSNNNGGNGKNDQGNGKGDHGDGKDDQGHDKGDHGDGKDDHDKGGGDDHDKGKGDEGKGEEGKGGGNWGDHYTSQVKTIYSTVVSKIVSTTTATYGECDKYHTKNVHKPGPTTSKDHHYEYYYKYEYCDGFGKILDFKNLID